MKKKYLSYSSLKLECPRALKMTLDKMPPETVQTEEGEEGTRLHKLLADAVETQKWSDWDKEMGGHPLVLEQKGWETNKRVEYEVEEQKIIGYPDLVRIEAETIHLIDAKSYRSLQIPRYFVNQLSYYALPLLVEYPTHKIIESIYFMNLNVIKDIGEYEVEDIGRFEHQIVLDVKKALEVDKEERPFAKTSAQCKYCNYSLSCELYPSYDDKKIEELVAEYIKIEAKREAVVNIFKDYCTTHGLVSMGGLSIGYHLTDELIVAGQELLQYMAEKGIPIETIFRADKREYKKAVKGNEELAQFSSVEVITRWGIKKEKEE